MINTTLILEKFLQNYRFKMAQPYLAGTVLDFGGNKGELKKYVKGKYVLVNYDHTPMNDVEVDTIVTLAVIEHIAVDEVVKIFRKFRKIIKNDGKVIITTPSRTAEPLLWLLSLLEIIDQENMREHKHYWNKEELYSLARVTGFRVKKYKKFQLSFNQFAILNPKK